MEKRYQLSSKPFAPQLFAALGGRHRTHHAVLMFVQRLRGAREYSFAEVRQLRRLTKALSPVTLLRGEINPLLAPFQWLELGGLKLVRDDRHLQGGGLLFGGDVITHLELKLQFQILHLFQKLLLPLVDGRLSALTHRILRIVVVQVPDV